MAVSTAHHYGNTEMPRSWNWLPVLSEQDQPRAGQVRMREGEGGPLAAAPTPWSPSQPGQSAQTAGMGTHFTPCTVSAQQEKPSRDERAGMSRQERGG